MQTDGFKQLRAAVRGDSRNAHFGHDLVQPFVDAVTVVQHHCAIAFLNRVGIDQFRQRFVRQVRINRGGTKAKQHGKVMRVAGAGGFNNDVGVAAQALIHQTGLNRANCHRCRNRQTIFRDIAVRQHQQHCAIADHLFRFIAQCFDRFFQRRFVHVKGDIQYIGAIVLFSHCGELIEIRPQQNRRFKA